MTLECHDFGPTIILSFDGATERKKMSLALVTLELDSKFFFPVTSHKYIGFHRVEKERI